MFRAYGLQNNNNTHCDIFRFAKCVIQDERKKATTNSATYHTRTAPAERICARKSQRWQPGDERQRPRTGRRAAIHSLLPIRLESEQQPCSTSNNLTHTRRPRRPRRRESARENRNDGSRAAGENDPGPVGAGAPRRRSF